MGNNNTSAIQEEDTTSEAEKKTHLDNHHEDSVKEENQINPTVKSEHADTKAAGMISVDTSEHANEISEEDIHEDGVKEDNQNIPTSEAKVDLENAAKASDDTTIELVKDTPPEDSHTDDLKGKIQTVSTAEGKDIHEKTTWRASNHVRSVSENDSLKGDTPAGDAHMENQMHPTAEDEDVQEKATGLASDYTRSKHQSDSLEGDTCKEDVNVDKHPTAEGKDVQEMAARLALDDKASDPKNDISQADTHANDKDESASILLDNAADVPGKSAILDSDDALNLRDSYGGAGQEILEVRQPDKSPNAESVEDGGEKCEILSSSSLEGTEDCGKQTESCLRENLLVTNHHHLESEPKQEEEDTGVIILDALDMSNEAELQESPVVDPNHNELVEVLSESSLQGSKSGPRGDFVDTNPLCPQDNDDVIDGETQTQEKDISSDKSKVRDRVRDRDELETSLGDSSGTKSDSPSGNKGNGNLLTKVNYITDDSLSPLSESVIMGNSPMYDFEENYKVLHEERKMSRSGSTIGNSHDYSPGECLQEPLNEFKGCMVSTYDMTIGSNGDSDGERNEVLTSRVSGITKTDKVERPKATENGHHFDACDNNPNKASDDTSTVPEQKQLVVPEAEVVPPIAVSAVVDCTEEEGEVYKKKTEETCKNPEASHATEKDFEGREMLEQCNSHLVTIDHVESFTLQNSASLLHIYSYKEGSENQTKNLTATSMATSDWKQENGTKSFCSKVDKLDSSSSTVPVPDLVDHKAFEKEWEDYSQHVEATLTTAANLSSEQCPNNSTFENGGYETRESTERFSTESNSDSLYISSQMQKSPSFNLNLQIEASSEESDRSPLLYEDKCRTEMPMEEKIVTMERSYTEKSKAPLLVYSKEDDEAHLLVTSQEQGNHAGTYKAVKEVTSTSPKPKEKRKPMSFFFINCMCCATVAN